MVARLLSAVKGGIQKLFPGYFSLVMATGIVSIAAHLLDMESIAQGLFTLNKIAYIILWSFLSARILLYFQEFKADMRDYMRGPGFYTLVAGTCVLGSQFVLISADFNTATILWTLGFILWHLLIYIIFTLLMVNESKPALDNGINGTWLIAVVATQSISILGTLLAANMSTYKETLLFYTLTMYLLGGMLYIFIMAIILYRLFFFKIEPVQLGPPYWISMGAVAISTLAGDMLILNANQWNFLAELLPFLKGMNILFWATATFWIPLLVILGVWRHVVKRFPVRYDPAYWSLVFPLGMYTVCTYQLAKALNLPFLYAIPRYFIYIAIGTWAITFIGLLIRLSTNLLSAPVSEKSLRT